MRLRVLVILVSMGLLAMAGRRPAAGQRLDLPLLPPENQASTQSGSLGMADPTDPEGVESLLPLGPATDPDGWRPARRESTTASPAPPPPRRELVEMPSRPTSVPAQPTHSNRRPYPSTGYPALARPAPRPGYRSHPDTRSRSTPPAARPEPRPSSSWWSSFLRPRTNTTTTRNTARPPSTGATPPRRGPTAPRYVYPRTSPQPRPAPSSPHSGGRTAPQPSSNSSAPWNLPQPRNPFREATRPPSSTSAR